MPGFEVTFLIDDQPTYYNVLAVDGHFVIKKSGAVVAIIEYRAGWVQTAGVRLETRVLEELTARIADQYPQC